jgi:hypothetical protein
MALLGTASGMDEHHNVGIGFLPNGKLIAFFGMHENSMRWKVSTYTHAQIKADPYKISEWSSEKNKSGLYTYPCVMSFADKVVVFHRKNVSNYYYIVMSSTVDGDNFTAEVTITAQLPNVLDTSYLWASLVNGKIILAGYLWTETPHTYTNLYYAYSDDEGDTWKKVNGSALSVPFFNDAKVLDSIHSTRAIGATLDENGKPIMWYIFKTGGGVTGDYNLKLAIYSAVLGQSGTWSIYNAIDENNNPILTGYNDFPDPFISLHEGRYTLYVRAKYDSSFYVTRFCRKAGFANKFDTVWKDTYLSVTAFIQMCYVWNKEAGCDFEAVLGEWDGSKRVLYARGIESGGGEPPEPPLGEPTRIIGVHRIPQSGRKQYIILPRPV